MKPPVAKPRLNGWKVAFVVWAVVSCVLIGTMALRGLSDSSDIAMLRDGFGRREAALSLLRRSLPDLLRLPGHPTQSDILGVLQRHNQGVEIVPTGSTLEMDVMRFVFEPGGPLERIERTDEYGFPANRRLTNRPAIPK